MEPEVGASTCASGNQIWKGYNGNLEPKLTKKQTHKIFCFNKEKLKFKITEKSDEPVSKNIIKIPNNKKKEPNKEYKKNNKDARFFLWRDPKTPIIKNIGIKLASKKKKKKNIKNSE